MEMKIKFERYKLLELAKNSKTKLENSIKETIEEIDGADQIERGYLKSELNIRSGYLFSSFLTEKTDTKLRVYSNVPYARIHELGGYTGKNYAAYMKPTGYFSIGVKILEKEFHLKLKQKIKEKLESKK